MRSETDRSAMQGVGTDTVTSHRGSGEPAFEWTRARNGVLRGLTASGVLLSAVVHLELYSVEGFKDIHIIGPLFLLNAIAGLVIGIGMLVWDHWLPTFLAVGFAATTLVFFYLSVTVGTFGLHETLSGTPQVMAEVAEWVALVLGSILLALQLWKYVPAGWLRRR
jgi:hypothetical protein